MKYDYYHQIIDLINEEYNNCREKALKIESEFNI